MNVIILRRECLTVLNWACSKIWTMDDGWKNSDYLNWIKYTPFQVNAPE